MEGSAVPTGNPTTSYTITIPTVAVDDILILSNTNRDADTDPAVSDNDSGGNAWAKIGGSGCLTVWWKRATSATSAKVITAGSQTGSCSGVLKVYRGCRLGTPYEAFATEANASGDESMAAIVSTRAGAMVVVCVGNDANDNSTATYTATNPATLAVTEKLSTGGSDCSNGQAHGVQGAAGTTGTLAWVQATNGASVSAAFALIPALTLDLTAGSMTYTGFGVDLAYGRVLELASGAMTYVGNDVDLVHGAAGSTYTLDLDSGAMTYVGFGVGLERGHQLEVASGAMTYTGFDVGLLWGHVLTVDTGSMVYTGFQVELEYSGGGWAGDYYLPGAYDSPGTYTAFPSATGGGGPYTKRPRLS